MEIKTRIIVTRKGNRINIKTAGVKDIFIAEKYLYITYANDTTEYIPLDNIITVSAYTYTYHTRYKFGSSGSTLRIMAPQIYQKL